MKVPLLPIISCIILFVSTFVSCDQRTTLDIYYDKNPQEIIDLAKKENRPFCLVFSEPGCLGCKNYENNLMEFFRGETKNPIVNIIDVSEKENHWYKQWLATVAIPTTCVFNPDGELESIIQGNTPRGFNCMKNVVLGDAGCAKYMFSHHLLNEVNYGDFLDVLNELFYSKLALEAGEDIQEKVESTLQTYTYPFSLYLKCLNEQNRGENESAVMTAYHLSTYSTNRINLHLYPDIFEFAKKVINPAYDPEQEPVLEIKTEPIRLADCRKNVNTKFTIDIRNTGKNTLEIYEIISGCDCVTYLGEKDFELEIGEEKRLEFTFNSTQTGNIKRSIVIACNGIESLKTVEINAKVN